MTARKPSDPPRKAKAVQHRLQRMRDQGLKDPFTKGEKTFSERVSSDALIDCGWGKLIFGQTFTDPKSVIDALRDESSAQRNIGFYIRDPHVVLSVAPQEVFLDPSHTYRLDLATYRAGKSRPRGYFIRRLCSEADAIAVNRIYETHQMVPVDPDFFWHQRDSRTLNYLVAEDEETGEIIGTVTGVDHERAFGDPEHGSSLWCLAVEARTQHPGVGEALVRRLSEVFQARGCAFMDLSVLHDNTGAIALYEKIGFKRVPFFTLKRKNPINEKLFIGTAPEDSLNIYARIIVDEARRRGIGVEILDVEGGYFRLSFGGRAVVCRESLCDLTSAIAMSRCDDKAATRRLMKLAHVPVPGQISANASDEELSAFLEEHNQVVVKPVRGEQGRGVVVGIDTLDGIHEAIKMARSVSPEVIIEEFCPGDDLRVVVINDEVVAAALRKPPEIRGDGKRTVRDLIARLARRREAATQGESTIPLDEVTVRIVRDGGFELDDVLDEGQTLRVRKTANLHTGGALHDVTDVLHPDIARSAVRAARAIGIPVVGVDFMVVAPDGPDHVFIEANERPGLANHEPQPTAERFIDLLFPLSAVKHKQPEADA
nr:N-acetylglutaminylglutamine synthetase [Marinicauda sp. Alg238-R41]